MASAGDGRFSEFNFLVDLGTAGGPHAGFQEISQIGKSHGLNKATDVTMKRGVISSSTLEDWLNQLRKAPQAHRAVKITLQGERHRRSGAWNLLRAVIVKYVGPSLNGAAAEIAIDELVLRCDKIEVDSPKPSSS